MEPAEEGRQKNSVYLHPKCFVLRSDELLNLNYDRSAVGAERPILTLTYS